MPKAEPEPKRDDLAEQVEKARAAVERMGREDEAREVPEPRTPEPAREAPAREDAER